MRRVISAVLALLLVLVHPAPARAADYSLTINTNSTSYSPGSQVLLSGTVRRAELPAPGIAVTYVVTNPNSATYSAGQLNTDATGYYSAAFALPTVPVGTWTVGVSAGDATAQHTFSVAADAYAITIEVNPAAATSGQQVLVSGTLTQGGSPSPGVPVTLTVHRPDASTFASRQATTDGSGRYSTSFALPPDAQTGTWSIGAAAGDATGQATFAVAADEYALTVEANPSTATSGQQVLVSGTLTLGGSPSPGVPVTLTVHRPDASTFASRQTTTGSGGQYSTSFALPPDAPTGTWTIDVSAALATGQATFAVAADEYALTVQTNPSTASSGQQVLVSGTLTQSGSPSPGAPVTLTVHRPDASTFASRQTITNGSGQYNTSFALPPDALAGTWTVAGAAATASAQATLTVTSGAAYAITLAASPTSAYAGQVVTFSGQVTHQGTAAPGTTVTLTVQRPDSSVAASSQVATDSGGQYSTTFTVPANPPLGAWTVDAVAGTASATAGFTVTSGTLTTITLSPATAQTVTAGNTIQFSAAGADAQGGAVTLSNVTWATADPSQGATGTVSANGLFTAARAGTLRVTASSGGVTGTSGLITIVPGPGTAVAITSAASVAAGNTRALTATVTDVAGNPVPGASVAWTATPVTGAATVVGSTLTGVSPGTLTITAAVGSVSAVQTLTVTPSTAATITVQPANLPVGFGGATLTVTGTNTHFVAGSTQVEVRSGSNPVSGATAAVTVAGATSLTFWLQPGLAAGTYTLRVVTGSEVATATVAVLANLVATLRNQQGTAVAGATVYIFPAAALGDYSQVTYAATDAGGQLQAYLAPGNYAVGSWLVTASGLSHNTYIPFTIVSATNAAANPTTLQEAAPNVTGQAVSGGSGLAAASVGIVPVDSQGWLDYGQMRWAGTDGSGNFGLTLPTGAYAVKAVSTAAGYIDTDVRFSVVADGPMRNAGGAPIASLLVVLAADNFSGDVRLGTGTTPAPHASVVLRPLPGQATTDTIWAAADASGHFAATLEPATVYAVVEVVTAAGESFAFPDTQYRITVSALGAATPATLTVRLPQPNVFGQALDESGQAVTSGFVLIERVSGTAAAYWVAMRSDGTWSAIFADGSYRATGISAGRWIEAEAEFTVVGGVASPALVVVQPPQPNATGTARDAEDQPITMGWVTVRPASAAADDWQQAVGAPTDAQGQFSLTLRPLLGNAAWRAMSAGNAAGWYDLDIVFTLPASNLLFQPPLPNVTGTVEDEQGNKLPAAMVAIGPRGATSGTVDWSQVIWAQANAAGAFKLRLPTGAYTLFNVWSQALPAPLDLALDFGINAGGALVDANNAPLASLVVRPPAPNVSGVVMDEAGTPQRAVHVGLRGAAVPDAATEQYVWTPTDAQGQFRLRLPAGAYVVRFVSGSTWQEYNLPFTVGAGTVALVVRPPVPNIRGRVLDRNGSPLAGAQVTVRPAGSTDPDSHIYALADGSGAFRMRLPTGRYEAIAISTAARAIKVSSFFDALAGVPRDITVAEPSPTVTGRLRDHLGRTVANGWVALEPAAARGDWSQALWFAADAGGNFEAMLTAGSWIVANVQGGEYGVHYDLADAAPAFTVTAGATTALGDVGPPAHSVSGVVYSNTAASAALGNAWLVIRPASAAADDWSQARWVQAGGNGHFSLYLPPAEYAVASVMGTTSYDSGLQFTAPAAALQVAPPVTRVLGTLTVNGQPLRAQLGIRPVVGGLPAASAATTRWVSTNAAGQWSLILPDGAYAVVALDDGTSRFPTDVRFQVSGGNATVTISITRP